MNKRIRGRLVGTGFALGAALALAAPLQAQQPPEPARVMVSAGVGVFRPSDEAFREIYDGTKVPVTAQLDVRVLRHVAVFAGVRHVRASGTAVVEEAGSTSSRALASDDLETRLRLTSFRAGGLILLPSGPWELRAGGGVSAAHYSEEWAGAGADTKGNQAGWMLQAGLTRTLGSRLFVGAGIEYSANTVEQKDDESLVSRLKLGGVDVLVSVGVRF